MGTYEDSAVRAVRFALKTQKALSDHALTCNIGITTGQCFCGTVGSSMRCVSARTSFLVGAHDIRFAGLSNPVQCHGTAKASPLPHLHRDSAHHCHICTGTRLTPTTSAPRLGSPLPHLHQDWARPLLLLHQDWAQPLPHLHQDWAQPLRGSAAAWLPTPSPADVDPSRAVARAVGSDTLPCTLASTLVLGPTFWPVLLLH